MNPGLIDQFSDYSDPSKSRHHCSVLNKSKCRTNNEIDYRAEVMGTYTSLPFDLRVLFFMKELYCLLFRNENVVTSQSDCQIEWPSC